MSEGLKGKFHSVPNSDGTPDHSKSCWTIFSNDTKMFAISVEEICKLDSSMSYDKIATREYGLHLLKWWKERTQGLTAFW